MSPANLSLACFHSFKSNAMKRIKVKIPSHLISCWIIQGGGFHVLFIPMTCSFFADYLFFGLLSRFSLPKITNLTHLIPFDIDIMNSQSICPLSQFYGRKVTISLNNIRHLLIELHWRTIGWHFEGRVFSSILCPSHLWICSRSTCEHASDEKQRRTGKRRWKMYFNCKI